MKTTGYFDYVRLRQDRQMILDSWILQVIKKPIEKFVQPDGRIRLWGKVAEAENRILRVIVLRDGETVHNAFFDRSFNGAES